MSTALKVKKAKAKVGGQKPEAVKQRKRQHKAASKKVMKRNSKLAQVKKMEEKLDYKQVENAVLTGDVYQASIDTIKRVTSLNLIAVAEVLSCFFSKLLSLGIANDSELDLHQIYQGYKYMCNKFLLMIQGQAGVTKLPRIICDLYNALSTKTLRFHNYGNVAYSFDKFDPSPSNVTALSIGLTKWALMDVDNQTNTWNSPATINNDPPDEESYNYFLRWTDKANGTQQVRDLLSTVVVEDYKSVLAKDASAFAYCYPFFGLTADSTTGCWNNSESITKITAPALAKYVSYPNPSQEVDFSSRTFTPNSGGPGQFLTALGDHPLSYFNKIPPKYCFLNFDDVVTRIVAWLRNCIEKKAGLGSFPALPLPFTYQSFRVAVRQMILQNAPNQFIGQFEGPNTVGNGQNYFQPLYVTANTNPSNFFGTMKIPRSLAENLGALHGCSYMFNYRNTSDNNFAQYIPVWGYYPGDAISNPTVILPGESEGHPMFMPSNTNGEQPISFADGQYGGSSNPNFVNMNSQYYQGVVNQYNDIVMTLQDVSEVIATNNRTAFGQGVPYLMFLTKIVKTIPPTEIASVGFEKMLYKHWGKREEPIMTPKGERKSINTPKLPPGTPNNLHYAGYTTCVPIPKEVHGLVNTWVVPTVRVDDQAPGKVTIPQWKVAAGEVIWVPYDTSNAPTVIAAADYFGANCTTGVGRDSTNEDDVAIGIITGQGKGAALANIIAGGLGSLMPGLAPVFKTLAQLVPI